jgi:hypothetical protein
MSLLGLRATREDVYLSQLIYASHAAALATTSKK